MSKELDTRKDEGNPTDPTRRQLGIGLLAVLGGGLGVVKTAVAFEPAAQGNFNAASQILGRYGVTVAGDDSRGHDVLDFQTVPLPRTEYSQIVGTRNLFGEIIPCLKTSVLNDDASFTHFHPNDTGGVDPCYKTTIEGHSLATSEIFDSDQGGIDPCFKVESQMLEGGHIGTITATHLHPNSTGEIIPCLKTTIGGPGDSQIGGPGDRHTLATHELFDSDQGGVDPCFKVESQMLEGGRLGAIEVSVNDPDENFSVRVGGMTYKLVNGELVLERDPGPS